MPLAPPASSVPETNAVERSEELLVFEDSLGPAVRHGHKYRGAGEPKGLGQSAGVRAGGVALIRFFAREPPQSLNPKTQSLRGVHRLDLCALVTVASCVH